MLVWRSHNKKIRSFLYTGHSWAATAGQHKINCNITVVISICSTEQQDICYPEPPLVLCRNGHELAYVFRMPRACSSSCLLCWTWENEITRVTSIKRSVIFHATFETSNYTSQWLNKTIAKCKASPLNRNIGTRPPEPRVGSRTPLSFPPRGFQPHLS